MSFCRSTASWIFLMRRNSRQSSAKSLALEDVASGKSFMYARNNSGPITIHWGTPETTSSGSDLWHWWHRTKHGRGWPDKHHIARFRQSFRQGPPWQAIA
jgi:hypothetical protein